MKLSEAIRLGALLKPQAFNGRSVDGSCALAAACDAVGIARITFDDGAFINYSRLEGRFPLLTISVTVPTYGWSSSLSAAIYTLNDTDHWTREAIADWVESIERAHEPGDTLQSLSLLAVGLDQ